MPTIAQPAVPLNSLNPLDDLYPPGYSPVTYKLEFSRDPLSVTSPTYVDITNYYLEGSYQRAVGEDGNPEAGSASFVLQNRDRRFEPDYAAGAYYPDIKPLRRFQLTIDGDVEFTGFVTSWDVAFPPITEEVTVNCVDGFGLLNFETLELLDPPEASSYSDVVSYDEPSFYYRLGEPEGTKLVSHVRTKKVRTKAGSGEWHTIRVPRHRWNTVATRAEVEGVSGPSGTYKSLPTLGEPGGILGDPDTCVRFDGTSWAKIALDTESTETVSGTRLSVEAWVKLFSTTAGQVDVVAGPRKASAGQLSWDLALATGLPVFAMVNSAGTPFAVNSASALTVGVWYHLVGVWNGSTVKLYVNGVLDSSAAAGASMRSPDANDYIGIAGRGGTGMNGWIDEVAIYEKELSAARIAAHYTAGSARGFAEQLAGSRISSLATHSLWSTAGISAGSFLVQPTMKAGQPKISEISDTTSAEAPNNFFYFDGTGNPIYKGWAYAGGLTATFGDTAADIAYEDLRLQYDDQIYNEVTVARNGGLGQTVTDATSASQYRTRRLVLSDLMLSSDTDAATMATTLLAQYKDPAIRVTDLVLNGTDEVQRAQILARDIGDLIRVKPQPMGGTAIDFTARIRSKSVSMPRDRAPMRATLGLTRRV